MPCPHCGEADAGITVALWSLGDDSEDVFTCLECESEFGVQSVRDLIGRWSKLLAWLDRIPNVED